jgi:hypothetical protein
MSKKKAAKKKAKGPRFGDSRRVFRLLVRFARGQRKAFVLAFLMLVFEAVTAVFEPWPLAYLIDFLQGDGRVLFNTTRTATIGILTAGIVALAAINSYGDSMAEVYLARGGRKVGYNLRVALFSHLEKLSLAFHNQRRTGDVLTRVTSDVTEVEEFITESVSDLPGGGRLGLHLVRGRPVRRRRRVLPGDRDRPAPSRAQVDVVPGVQAPARLELGTPELARAERLPGRQHRGQLLPQQRARGRRPQHPARSLGAGVAGQRVGQPRPQARGRRHGHRRPLPSDEATAASRSGKEAR